MTVMGVGHPLESKSFDTCERTIGFCHQTGTNPKHVMTLET
jgi:hypothetical protein